MSHLYKPSPLPHNYIIMFIMGEVCQARSVKRVTICKGYITKQLLVTIIAYLHTYYICLFGFGHVLRKVKSTPSKTAYLAHVEMNNGLTECINTLGMLLSKHTVASVLRGATPFRAGGCVASQST